VNGSSALEIHTAQHVFVKLRKVQNEEVYIVMVKEKEIIKMWEGMKKSACFLE
jgi:hypothetical protein